MKRTAIAIALSWASIVNAQAPTQKQQLAELMQPYGQHGQIIYKSIVSYSERCGHKDKELSVLLYFGASFDESTRDTIINAPDEQTRERLINELTCPI